MLVISQAESDAFYQAGNRLYELFVKAADHVIQHNLMDELGIPTNLRAMIRHTWEDDRHLHLFGRFDLVGGINGLPMKMLEFNADTPTSLPETAIIQWAQLKANDIAEDKQFNFIYEALTDNFIRLKNANPEKEATILFSTLRDALEDEHNVAILRDTAKEAGFETHFCYVDEVNFSEMDGIYAPDGKGNYTRYDFWFKLIPWEYIAEQEAELCAILTKIVQRNLAVIVNPAYTLLFQSKGILKYLWDLFPNEPLLLEATFKEPIGRSDYPFVQKVFFGREGANVTIYDEIGLPLEVRDGEYGKQKSVYQAYADLARDEEGQYYQAGVFFAYEACGLGFRRSPQRIIDNGAQFVGHLVGE